ncbi:MAG: ABC transporter substrate-binding protein [Chloroflexi bacterium]|nr:ABC transporter substrate-binding protein [Chloroflexota bacterium]
MSHQIPARRLTRRQLVQGLSGAVATLALAACAPIQPPAPTAAPARPAAPAAQAQPTPAAKTETKPAAATKPATDAKPTTQTAAQPATQSAAARPVAEAKPAGQPKRGGTLTWGRPHDILHFDSSQLSATQEPILLQVWATLIRLDDQVKPQPELAESWDLSSDYKRMQLKLRKGATFHNGKEITADAVVGTIQRYQDASAAANIRPQIQRFKEPKAVDPHTVEISFDEPMATVFDALDLMFIWDPDNFETIKQQPNGSGPFKLAEWQPGNQTRLVRHDGYYKSGQPYLDEIVVKAYPDFEGLLIAAQTGAVDVANPLRPRDKAQVDGRPGLTVVPSTPGTSVFDVTINTTRPPLDDKRVRQAISYAVNRQRFVNTYLAGLSEPWSLPWRPGSPAFDAALNKTYDFNPDKAKQLLAEAGHPNGFETTILATKGRPGYAELAEQLQNDLAQVGIKARIDLLEEAAWRPRHINGDLDLAPHSFGRATKHPASVFEQAVVWRSDKNSSSFINPEYQRLTRLASQEFDPQKARTIYDQLNHTILDEAFTLVVAPDARIWAVRDRIKGFTTNLEDWSMMEGVWLDT